MSRWSPKEEADSLKQVSVYFFKKHGYFRSEMSGTMTWSRNGERTGSISIQSNIDDSERYIRFTYTQTDRDTGEKQDFDYNIPLVTTPCHFGGSRYWFQCPWYTNGIHCGRRVGVLYLEGKHFACRHCYNLTYESQKLSGFWKALGTVTSTPDLDEMEANLKRKWYAGKMTKKYRNFLKRSAKAMRALTIAEKSMYRT